MKMEDLGLRSKGQKRPKIWSLGLTGLISFFDLRQKKDLGKKFGGFQV